MIPNVCFTNNGVTGGIHAVRFTSMRFPVVNRQQLDLYPLKWTRPQALYWVEKGSGPNPSTLLKSLLLCLLNEVIRSPIKTWQMVKECCFTVLTFIREPGTHTGWFRSSSSQLWTFFLFTLPCNNRCSQGEVIKNRVKASPLLLSPLCPFSCQEKRQAVTVCVSPGVFVESLRKAALQDQVELC